ncbi:MAG: 4-hydroxy-tetrahydrodipicolinate reductase [Bacteroidota bacterium]
MKFALIGYGKMGKAIEAIALSRGHDICARYDSAHPLTESSLTKADVAIEFSTPALATKHMRICLEAGVPVVTGTTGWYAAFPEMQALSEANGTGLFTASNFSLGVNIFFSINEQLARIMAQHPDYRVAISETHHVHKKDAPSGTAISLAAQILEHMPHLKSWSLGRPEQVNSTTLTIESIRTDEVPGTHDVVYYSAIDTISIQHTAHSRAGFALGAVLAAEFLQGKHGVYGMKDLLQF